MTSFQQTLMLHLSSHSPKFGIQYNVDEPDFGKYEVTKYNWFAQYGECKEELPEDMPEPKGKSVVTSGFFDSDHAGCLQTRTSTAATIMLVNSTPVR